jgi:DNA-binding NarL/FixJ family response regulator
VRPTTPGPIRVAIVEDDRALRDGLAYLIDTTEGFVCPHGFDSVEDALPALCAEPADVLLLDINLPGMPGTEGVKLFRAALPDMQVLILSVYADQDRVFESICNGACGYLLKTTPPEKVVEAVRDVHAGGSPMSPEIARKVVTLFHRTRLPELETARLTSQEVRLLKLLAEGASYQASAQRLEVSVNTVRNYIRSIYDKLHVHSKSEAVGKAIRTGLI